MRNRLLPLALLALVVGLWLALRGEERQGSRGRPSVSPDAIALPAVEVEPPPLTEALAPPEAIERPTRTVATTAYEEELAGAVWVEGRIEFPPSTPSDEHVRVRGKGKEFKHGPLHTAEVSPDGAFRVAFAQGTKKAEVELDARYLYLEDRVRVDPRKPTPVRLTPEVGGVIRGRVVPPPGAPEDPHVLVGCTVMLANSTVELGDDLSFEFTALAPDSKYILICDPLIYETARVEELYARRGAEITVEVQLQDGVGIAGTVLDEDGAPVAGATVVSATRWWSQGTGRNTKSGPGGEFQLRGVTPGSVHLSVQAKGYQELDHDLGNLDRGTSLTRIELRLPRGYEIAGRVLWPDGSPARNAAVVAEPLDPAESSVAASSNASGEFSIEGLKPGAYRVGARAARRETRLVKSELLGRERSKKVFTTLHAAAQQVEAGTTSLLLKLSQGQGVSGTVLDERGAPLERFSVRTVRTADEDRTSASFKDAGGTFVLSDLAPGGYALTVEAKGFLSSQPVAFVVPLESPLAPIRLTRAPRLSGVVMTPGGLPAPKARIELMEQAASSFRNSHYALACKSGNDGRFEVDDAGFGTFKVRAVQEGYVASDPIELALAQGSQPADIVLRLRPGATLTGMVVDADGMPCPDRRVELSGKGEGKERTDTQGAFVFTGLEPGRYRVEASPSTADLKALGLSTEARDALSGRNWVTLDESGGHVVVQVPVACAVRVYGTLSVAGRAAMGRLAFDHARGPVWADAQGAYEVLLPGPGEYDVKVQLSEADLTVELEAVIHERAEERFDVNILLGAIEGRVLGPQGPVADIDVDLHSAVADFTATTAEDGSYAVENVPAGSWTISAGGSRDEIYFEAVPSPYLRARLKGVEVVGGQRLRGIDLHLEGAGIVTGTVITPEGEPAKGMPAEEMSVIMSDASGDHEDVRFLMGNTFSVGGLEPGTYSFRVVSEGRFAEGSAVAEAGKETKLELRLGPATLVRVPVHDPDSEDARILCRRSDGADFSDVRVVFGFDENARVVGPLPPGTYTLQVEGNGSPQAAKTLTLTGEPEVLLDLGL